jgi:hypothetical protein
MKLLSSLIGGSASSNQFFSRASSIWSSSSMLAGSPFPYLPYIYYFIFSSVSDTTSGFLFPWMIGSGEYGFVCVCPSRITVCTS